VSAAPTDLDELRRRVRADPGSRYFLGLAEELLRAGHGEEALGVLEAGLEARPGHLAASVAKARCLVGLGRRLDGWAALEPILARDPAHLVAAKLAVEIWLGEGVLDRARAALERYGPLGTADPDLRRFQERMAELEAKEGAAATGAAAKTAPPPGGTPEATPDDGDELVTVTLGNLYLLQGHRADAVRIFQRILRADPDNAAARQALARALGSSSAPAAARQDI